MLGCARTVWYYCVMKEESPEIDQKDLVELALIEGVARRLPKDDCVLRTLGDLYTRVGRYEDGLAIDRRLVKLCPGDSMAWYNLGCSLALLGMRAPALRALRRAVALGYDDAEWMSRDVDLRSLREDRAFRTLLKKLSGEGARKTED